MGVQKVEWTYNEKKFGEKEAQKALEQGVMGFIYRITDDTGKWYIGKKAFTHRKKTKLSKKARIGTRKRIDISYKDSGWADYWGSCRPLLEYIQDNGNQGFTRVILKLCNDRASLGYWEIDYLCTTKALFNGNSWNSNIAGKYFRGKIHE